MRRRGSGEIIDEYDVVPRVDGRNTTAKGIGSVELRPVRFDSMQAYRDYKADPEARTNKVLSAIGVVNSLWSLGRIIDPSLEKYLREKGVLVSKLRPTK